MEGAGQPSAPSSDSGNLTTTGSGLPIAPVYAGALSPYNFGPVIRARRTEFRAQAIRNRPDYGTEFRNPFVPRTRGPKGGIDITKHMSGTGQIFDDPLDLFKTQKVTIDKKPQGVRRPSRPIDQSRQRKKATSAYRKNNKENIDAGGKF